MGGARTKHEHHPRQWAQRYTPCENSEESDHGHRLTPLVDYPFKKLPADEMVARADAFYSRMNERRSVRYFSGEPVSRA